MATATLSDTDRYTVISADCHAGASMDTYRDYLALNELWSRGEAPWKIW